MENVQAQKEFIKASRNGVVFTVLRLLEQGMDPNVADEVVISIIYFLAAGALANLVNLFLYLYI